MELSEYLLETYGYNEPIMLNEISFKNYSRPWINKELAKLCEAGKLLRFEKGIYYVPKITLLGTSKLNPQKVIEKKYISENNKRCGYYSGITFLNQTGLSTQVPNEIEIYTNNETAKVREVKVGSVRVILRKSRAPINSENVAVQSFLELMNSVTSGFFDDKKRKITSEFIEENKITRSAITKYACVFPDKAMRTLIESEIIYDVTRG